VVLIVLALQLGERLFEPEVRTVEDSAEARPEPVAPVEAQVSIEDEDTVVIETASHQRTRIRTADDPAAAEELARCIRDQLERLSEQPPSESEGDQETIVLFGLRIEGRGTDPRVDRAVQNCVMQAAEDASESSAAE
jgi:hypothetical protein